MKKLGLFLLTTLMSVCLFTSCSDDDKDVDLVGKWNYSKISIDFKSNSTSAVDALVKKTIEQNFSSEDLGHVLEFTDKGKVIVDGYSDDYEVNGNKLTMPHDEGYATMDFAISGKSLTLYLDIREELQAELDETSTPGIGDITIERAIIRVSYTKQ